MASAVRYRNFATVFYPESKSFDEMKAFLTDLHVPAFISPLHDQDINATGERKKEHYHVMLMFEGKKSKDQIQELLSGSGSVGVEAVNSLRGYARYLCHLDNPEKHQYSTEDVVSLSGADYDDSIGLPTNDDEACQELMEIIDQKNFISFDLLAKWCTCYRKDLWKVLKHSSTLFIKEYLKSRTWRLEKLERLTGNYMITEEMLKEKDGVQ